MRLATRQKKLLCLIRGTGDAVKDDDDPYIRRLAGSDELDLVKEIVLWWRAFDIERYCILTTAILKSRLLFDEAIMKFVRKTGMSPFVERLGMAFLEDMGQHTDKLIASVAQFEQAFIKVKGGDPETYTIEWQYNPYRVIRWLSTNEAFDEKRSKGEYISVVSGSIGGTFAVYRGGKAFDAGIHWEKAQE